MILHGDGDPIVPVDQSWAFVKALRSDGAIVIYREVPDVTHDDDIAINFQDDMAEFLLRDSNHSEAAIGEGTSSLATDFMVD